MRAVTVLFPVGDLLSTTARQGEAEQSRAEQSRAGQGKQSDSSECLSDERNIWMHDSNSYPQVSAYM